jgi:hypothetical protein
MGSRCTQAPVLDGNPAKLRSSSMITVCDRCLQEGVSGDLPAEVHAAKEPPTNLSRCRSCGKPDVKLLDARVCEECAAEVRTRGYIWEPYAPPLSVPPVEEKFAELFRATRALFDVGVVDEDVVYPTLVFANEMGQRLDFVAARERLVAAGDDANLWHKEADEFARKFTGFKPIRAGGETLFLEMQPASAVIRNYQTTSVPKEVEIRVYPRRKPASPQQVAATYEEALSDAGIPYDISDRISMDAELREGLLWILVGNGEDVPEEHAPIVWRGRSPRFPHPRLIGALYNALYGKPTQGKDGFARYLITRQRSRDPEMYNLIPACAAFFLSWYGRLKQGEIHDLLNKYILRDYHPQGEVPKMKDDSKSYNSRKSQLWDDVKRVEPKLLRVAHLLYSPGE